jgi:hypothetical protein
MVGRWEWKCGFMLYLRVQRDVLVVQSLFEHLQQG